MNKDVRVRVKTPVGLTRLECMGPGTAQGSVDAAIVSSTAMGKGVDDTFGDSDSLLVYHGTPLPAQCFMDDVLKSNENLKAAQTANDLMEELMRT